MSRIGVLLIHGFAGTPLYMRPLGDFLEKRGLKVSIVTLAGHGLNPEALLGVRAEDWLASAEESLAKLRNESEEVFIVGYSFGGNLAVALAHKYPEVIKGVVTLCTPVYLKNHRLRKIFINLFDQLKIKKFYTKSWVKGKSRELYLKQGEYLKIPFKAMAEFLKFIGRSRKEFVGLKTPFLIIQTKSDRLVNPKSAQCLFQGLQGKKKLVWLDNLTHSEVIRQAQPDLWQTIYDFIMNESRLGKGVSSPGVDKVP